MIEKTIEFLEENKIPFLKPSSDTVNLQADCPLCTDTKKRLGIKIRPKLEGEKVQGEWKCFNCSARGKTLNTLKRAVNKNKSNKKPVFFDVGKKKSAIKKQNPLLADKCHEILFEEKNKQHLEYILKERNLSLETIKHFKIGLRSKFKSKTSGTYDAGPHLVFPAFEDGNLCFIKYRCLDPEKKPKWRREEGGKTVLFNGDITTDYDYDEIFIAESEIDSMSLWSAGLKNVVGLTAGADSFDEEWIDQLSRYEKVYLVLDNDEPGQMGAKKIASRLGLGRCYNILLPQDVKDPNEYFQKYSRKDFDGLISKAKLFNLEEVKTLHDIIQDHLSDLENDIVLEEGYQTGYKSLDSVLGNIKGGNLVVIAARPKVGKTTFAMNLIKNHVKLYGHPTFNYQCEMEPSDMVSGYVGMSLPYKDFPDLPAVRRGSDGKPEFRSKSEMEEYKDAKNKRISTIKDVYLKLPTRKLISYHPKSQAELELGKVCDIIRKAVQRYGCKFVVFDNLHFLCRGKDAKEQIEMCTQAFKMLARELDIVFVCVTHPRKTNHNKELDNDDLKESGSIFQDADAVVLLHRDELDEDEIDLESLVGETTSNEDLMSKVMQVKVTARRKGGGRCRLYFNTDKSLIMDNPELVRKEETKQAPKKKESVKNGKQQRYKR